MKKGSKYLEYDWKKWLTRLQHIFPQFFLKFLVYNTHDQHMYIKCMYTVFVWFALRTIEKFCFSWFFNLTSGVQNIQNTLKVIWFIKLHSFFILKEFHHQTEEAKMALSKRGQSSHDFPNFHFDWGFKCLGNLYHEESNPQVIFHFDMTLFNISLL